MDRRHLADKLHQNISQEPGFVTECNQLNNPRVSIFYVSWNKLKSEELSITLKDVHHASITVREAAEAWFVESQRRDMDVGSSLAFDSTSHPTVI